MIAFEKYHGLGNDYLVIEDRDDAGLPAATIERLCHRSLGVGSDGVLLRGPDAPGGRFHLRIFNPDGSEAEKSGNGLRIFARYLWDRGEVGEKTFRVRTAGGEVACRVLADGRAVRVEMGQASFASEAIPVAGPPRDVLRETLEAAGERLEFSAVTIGNPHCVIFRDPLRVEDALRLGPAIEHDPRFPNRTNVQLVRVRDRANIEIEIWERGAGHTLASGSSACAAAAVAHRLGRCDARVTVHMPGGSLAVEIDAEGDIVQQGPVVHVASGTVHDEALA